MMNPSLEHVIDMQARVVALLNQVEGMLTSASLGYSKESVAVHTGPLYEMCDTDTPPSRKGAAS